MNGKKCSDLVGTEEEDAVNGMGLPPRREALPSWHLTVDDFFGVH